MTRAQDEAGREPQRSHMGGMNLPLSSPRGVSLRLQLLLLVAAGLVIVIAVLRVWVCWSNDRYIDHAAGAWIALAADLKDLKDGVFYRPLFGPSGYGGTRYFPLYFVLHALLLRLGIPVLLSGYLLSAAAMILLILGAFQLLRVLGAEPWLAACSASAILASYSVQLSLLSTRADGLAAALNIWGIAMSAYPKPSRSRILLASILFTLAWSTKLTTVFGFAASFLWLMFAGSSGMAWALAAETACGCLAVMVAMFLASQGRILGILKACSSGGANPILIASGPWHMLNIAAREDPGLLVFFFLALLSLSLKSLRNLPTLFFVSTLAITAIIFGSPGTNFNHLLDVQVAAVVLFTAWLSSKESPLPKELGIYALLLATLLAAVPLCHKLEIEDRLVPPHRFDKAIAFIGDVHKPVLAENPVLPVLAGQRPYLMDPFMLRVLWERNRTFGQPILEGLRNHDFCAVVLFMRDPRTSEGRAWYEKEHFGPGFLAALNSNYQLAAILDGQFIYLPGADTTPNVPKTMSRMPPNDSTGRR
jgi:hypothetical protein